MDLEYFAQLNNHILGHFLCRISESMSPLYMHNLHECYKIIVTIQFCPSQWSFQKLRFILGISGQAGSPKTDNACLLCLLNIQIGLPGIFRIPHAD